MRIFGSKTLNLAGSAFNALMAWYWWGSQDGTALARALLVMAVFAGTSQLYLALNAWEAEVHAELEQLKREEAAVGEGE